MLQLTNAQLAELHAAILAAFPGFAGFAQLDRLLRDVEIDIAYVAIPFTPVDDAVYKTLVQENAKGKIADVIGAARRANPGNPQLAGLERTWLKTSAAGDQGRLEAMVLNTLNYAPASTWNAKLQDAYRWVCRVERRADSRSLGTGFLVADDLVLTNYHVLYGTVAPGRTDPIEVQLRFDAVGDAEGRPVQPAAADWLVASSRPADSEWAAAAGEPTAGQLDFALMRLAEPVGNDGADGHKRGHAPIEPSVAGAQALNPVVVLQHPLGGSLQICLGAFDQPNSTGTRLRHTATTQRGSSGSPCLSMDLKVVGLHNGGLGGRNSAIPLPLIAAFVNQNGTVLPVA